MADERNTPLNQLTGKIMQWTGTEFQTLDGAPVNLPLLKISGGEIQQLDGTSTGLSIIDGAFKVAVPGQTESDNMALISAIAIPANSTKNLTDDYGFHRGQFQIQSFGANIYGTSNGSSIDVHHSASTPWGTSPGSASHNIYYSSGDLILENNTSGSQFYSMMLLGD